MAKIQGGQFWQLLEIDDNNPEYELYKSLIEEFTQISGFPIKYYVKIISDVKDNIYGEDPNSEFSNGYETKLIYEPTEETNILDSFGITSDETIAYMQLPKSMFKSDIEEEWINDNITETSLLPKIGDCIRTLWNNKLYEIVETGSEQKLFQGRKMIWEFVTRPYRYSEESDSAEDMLTEIPDDSFFPEENITTTVLPLSASGDNEEIEELSDEINDYTNIDTGYYGY